jgi:hypothetical protein
VKRRLYTINQFAQLPEPAQRDAEGLSIATASLDEPQLGSDRLVTYTFSTPAVGRDMHTVASDAWNLQNFLRNPVFLWAHDDSLPPIGRVVQIGDVAGKLKGAVSYAERDVNPFADTIYQLVKRKYINAVSTSWLPQDWTQSRDPARPRGLDFTQVDLLEISQVPIPALPTALAEARSVGIDTGPIVTWAERILDTAELSERCLVPRSELETLRRAAMAKTSTTTTPAKGSLKAKHERAIARAPKVPVFQRGLYQVAQLAYMLEQMGYCHASSEYEEALEEDNSPVPGMLGDVLAKLGEALKAMTTEEVDELLEACLGEEDEVDAEPETRSLPAEDQAHIAAGKTARARAWRAGIAVARAGKGLSSKNEEHLEDAQAHHDRGMKHHRALGENQEAVSGHLKEARGEHEEATSSLDQLGEHLRAAAESPDDPAHVKNAAKAHKTATKAVGAIGEQHRSMGDRHEDAGDSHRALGRCMKSAHRCVRTVIDGATPADDAESGNKPGKEEAPAAADRGSPDKTTLERGSRERRARAHRYRGAAA